MAKVKKIKGAIILLSTLLVGCADQLPPSGGPVDPTPPEITSAYPEDGTLNFKGDAINIEFKHYVDERTFEESIFISPSVGTLEFDWSGKEVKIRFPEKLRQNMTYVVNIGTDVKDKYRNSMRLPKAYAFAFSTGPEIDRGGIEGTVFPRLQADVMSGIMIFAYRLNGLNVDTLNPTTTSPDFITQTGKNGDFFLYHIPFGDYRIFAIRDEYRNLIYDKSIDEYGVQSGNISITPADTLVTGVFMKLAKEDTTGPMLVKVTAHNKNHITAEFSEPIDPATIDPSSFFIFDTLSQKPLSIVTVFPSPSALNSFIAVTETQDSTKMYRLLIRNAADSAGNKVQQTANSMIFGGSPKTDTLKLKLSSVSLRDSVQGVELQPRISLVFSDALAKSTSLDSVNLLDNKGRSISVKKELVSDVLITVISEKELLSNSWYTLHADMHNFRDWSGRVCRDSIKDWHFETLDAEDLCSIEGEVTDLKKTQISDRLYVIANQYGEKNSRQYRTVVDSTGKFTFQQIVEGHYVLQAFVDRNKNGLYDTGKPFPFTYSERISQQSDTLKVRARWVFEGVTIRMK